MKLTTSLLLIFVATSYALAQDFSGKVISKETKKPIEFVNIGVLGKSVGTVSDMQGNYSLALDPTYDNDTLMFSCIGYHPFVMQVGEFKNHQNHDIALKERFVEIDAVVVRPGMFRERTLGYSTKSKIIMAGFDKNLLGYECGVKMRIRKPAYLETANINFVHCSYDTIFYRLNIYKVKGRRDFENILTTPIYIELPKDQLGETVVVDLRPYNIKVDTDFMVALEHVKDLGQGYLYFSAGVRGRTYVRKTSQDHWETAPVGISISVDARVEK